MMAQSPVAAEYCATMVAAVGTNIVLKQTTFPGCIMIVYRCNASARAEYCRAEVHICSTRCEPCTPEIQVMKNAAFTRHFQF